MEENHSITSWTSRPSRGPAWNAGDKEQSEGPCLADRGTSKKEKAGSYPGEKKKENGNAVGRCRWDEAYESNGAYGANGILLYLFAGGGVTGAIGKENVELTVIEGFLIVTATFVCFE